ncbi:hypothetical protein P186_2742 [Pyrobaculum ferrireducens]|uniref:Uncharacterized protein n=1 Tax=Pyrobaculum ferrireducens TaxID=1104324 RepID=G7VEV8_9CREN|nr:hypothetical protein P186_2742 [Pyrobaculum ferrireducens]
MLGRVIYRQYITFIYTNTYRRMERSLIVGVLALLIAIGALILGLATWSKVSAVERDIPHKIDQLNTSLGG